MFILTCPRQWPLLLAASALATGLSAPLAVAQTSDSVLGDTFPEFMVACDQGARITYPDWDQSERETFCECRFRRLSETLPRAGMAELEEQVLRGGPVILPPEILAANLAVLEACAAEVAAGQ